MALYAFDGTWNSEKDAARYDRNTNVVRFKDQYGGTRFFYKGVGTRHGSLGKFLGGAFGVGGRDRIDAARKDLAAQFEKGDRDIDIVGFSRGAALAAHFANVIADDGVVVKGVRERPPIRFLGVFDLVAAFGIAINLPGFNFNRMNLGYKLGLSPGVQHCYHALALDEARQSFRPTRLRGPNSQEVWFRGVHSDVGGGNDNHALNDIALRWMLHKAMASGLPMAAACVEACCQRADPAGKIGDNFDPIRNRAREPKEGDLYHYTVVARARHVNPPEPCARETEALELRAWVAQ